MPGGSYLGTVVFIGTPTPAAQAELAPSPADDVLLSKTLPPACQEWVIRRARIDQRIAAAPLTVVTGPPGAGKTTAAASWAAGTDGPVAWVTLDRYDSQWGVFWPAVVTALGCAGVEFGRPLPPPGRTDNHPFLLRLAAELAVQDPPATLVLDDLHQITGHDLDDGLQYLIRNTRPGLRVVICSRADPVISLHHYRLAGELTEIRAAELAFSVAEARLLMARHGVTLPDGLLAQLTELNEGWAAGLRLAALSLRAEPDPGQLVRQFAAADGAVAGYLMDEVLNHQPARSRHLLLRTSIVDRVSASLAAEMTGDEGAGDVLGALARANAFVEPAGNGWYRFHSLFAEVLRARLRFDHPDEVADLHRRAARWYRRQRCLLDAVRQATAAGDWLPAARMVVDDLAVPALLEEPDGAALTGCFRDGPNAASGAEPQPLLVAAAVALADRRESGAQTALDAVEGTLADVPAGEETAARICLAMLRLEFARRTGDSGLAAVSVEELEGHARKLRNETLAREPRLARRLLAERGLLLLRAGQPDDAAASVSAGHSASDQHGPECADYHGHLALAEAFRGRLPAAARIIETTCPPDGGGRRLSPAAEVAIAFIHLERNDRQEARSALKRADAALRSRPDRLAAALACFAAARCRLAEGHPSAVAELAARARLGWSPPGWLDHRLTLLESRASAAAGDTDAAVAAAERADPAVSPDSAAALAQARLDAGDLRAAGSALGSGPGITSGTPAVSRMDWWLAEARLAFGHDDDVHGRQALIKAVKLGEREGLRLSLALEGTWMRPALRADPPLAEACRHLLAHDPAGDGPLDAADLVVVDELSEREREVLRLLAGMLTTAEVADELYISVNTVKSHLKSIYRKLAARHRGEAVRRAQELRMI